jgi:lysophospholipase L1-like esterase
MALGGHGSRGGGSEAAFRYREHHRTVVPGTLPTLFYRHYRLRHAMVRDFSYFGWVGIDSLGFRRTSAPPTPGARPVVLVIGGSTVFDSQVSGDDRAWPAVVERMWREATPPFAGDLINGGVPGYLVVDNLIRLETDLADFRPDLLVVYDGHNDLYAALGRGGSGGFTARPGRTETRTPWTAWLEEHSLLYSKVAGRLQAMRSRQRATARAGAAGNASAGGTVDWGARVEAATRRFARDLEALVVVARTRGIPVVLVTVTHVSAGDSVPRDSALARSWMLTVGGTPPAVVLEAYRRYNAAVREIAGRHDVPVIDGSAAGVAGPEFYAEGDPIHFNDAGAERFAQFVAPRLAWVLAEARAPNLLH